MKKVIIIIIIIIISFFFSNKITNNTMRNTCLLHKKKKIVMYVQKSFRWACHRMFLFSFLFPSVTNDDRKFIHLHNEKWSE